MVDDDSGERAREQAKKKIQELSMGYMKSMKQHLARARSLTLNVIHHNVEVIEQETSRRVLNGLPTAYAPEKQTFALKTEVS